MPDRPVRPGDVLVIRLPEHRPKGHEQEGQRPAIVVAVPRQPLRYPVVIVVPVTSQTGPWSTENPGLYLRLPAGAGGLPRPSTVLVDQIQSVDVGRVGGFLGALSGEQHKAIARGVAYLLDGPTSG